MARAIPHLPSLTAMHSSVSRIGEAAWAVDLDVGTLTFSFADGRVVTAPVQVIGTYNTEDGTWMWGWDHPSVPAARAADARTVKAFGEKHGVADLTTRKMAVYELFWRRDDDYHHPISAGWPSNHDPAQQSGWRVYALGPDAWRVAFELDVGVTMHHAYDVRRFEDGLRIVDFPLGD